MDLDNPNQTIATQGSAYIAGNVEASQFIGRDEVVQGDVVHGDKIVGGEPIRLPTAAEVQAYLQAVRHAYARWADQPAEPDSSLVQPAGDPAFGPDVFITLRALPMRVARYQAQPGGQPPPAQDLLAALATARRAIILGEPGSGKSTALERIAWATATDALATPAGQPLAVPILAPLSGYRGQADALPILDQALKLHGLHLDNLASLRQWLAGSNVQILLLLDGLNELRQEHRQNGLDAIRSYVLDNPRHRVYLTCRTADFDAAAETEPALQVLPQAQIWTVEPLEDNIRFWDDAEGHSDVREYLRHDLGNTDGKRLYDKVRADDRLRTLARLPLFLWMIKETGVGGGELPVDRGGLVQKFMKSSRLWARTPFELRERAERSLEALGWRMQELGALQIDGDELDAVLDQERGRRSYDLDAMRAALQSTGLLVDLHDGNFRLLHQLIQEYAAAAHLVRDKDCAQRLVELAQNEWWRETTIMALWLRHDLHTPAYLQGLMAEPAVDLRVRIAAATVLSQVGDPRFVRRSYTLAPTSNDGVRVVEASEPQMVTIPAGLALLGGEDPDAGSDELPQSHVPVSAFELAVYPVTNAEYRCFVESGGYDAEADWWTPGGRAWLRGEGKLDAETEKSLREEHRWLRSDIEAILVDWKLTRSLSEEEADQWRTIATEWSEDQYVDAYARQVLGQQRTEPYFWRDSRFNQPAQPVVGVNWYEANAYATWLARVTDRPYRLSSEAEWEWAARRSLRRYPWGDEWDPARCNSSDSKLAQPSPVGVYPHGVTPDGLHDLAGNVYEWTATLYRPYPYDPADGREDPLADGLRVARGGSWYVGRTYERCAFRDRDVPWDWYNHLGYRLARSLL